MVAVWKREEGVDSGGMPDARSFSLPRVSDSGSTGTATSTRCNQNDVAPYSIYKAHDAMEYPSVG
jgi:hypothetical protein